MVKFREATLLGLVPGVLLGLLFKVIERLSSIKIYTLLLNVDFVPVIGEIHWGEGFEFAFHLLFSLILGFIYWTLVRNANHYSLGNYVTKALLVILPTIFLYIPLVILAEKEVPDLTDIKALIFWVIGHIIYGLILGVLGYYLRINRNNIAQ